MLVLRISVIFKLDVITFHLLPLNVMMEAIAQLILAIQQLDVFTHQSFAMITTIAHLTIALSLLDVSIHL
jgi:hypothetical protein